MHKLDSLIRDSGVEPRPYQRRIITKVVQMFQGRYVNGAGETEPAVRSVMVESPTGSGKSIMGLLTAKVMQTSYDDLAIGWVAMRRNLLTQAERENRNKAINADVRFVSMFEHRPDDLIAAKKQGRPVLLVVDEAQHDAASSMAHLHNVIEPDFIMGMTATPFRTDRVKLCFEKVVKDAGIHQLIQDGFLSPYYHYSVPKWEPKVLANFYCAEPERWGKSIFYFVDLEQCFQFAQIMRERGVDLEVVTGSTDREEQIRRFEDPDGCDVLVNCMVLTEGFDFPGLKTAWVRDSGKGPTMQMGGRVFRQHPELPYKQIVQSKLTRWPFIKTATPAQSHVWANNEWRTLQVNPHLERINSNSRLAIATTEVEIPEFILRNREKRSNVWRG